MYGVELDREAERLARQQHGVLQRDQVLQLGFSPTMIFHRVKAKAWLRLAPSVYAIASHPSTWQRQYKAAELATPGSAVAQLAAGKVHSWDGFNTVKPEVVASHTTNHRNRLAVVHRAADLKVTTVNGIRVTTQAQTLCDVLTRIRLDRWEQTADRLLLTGKMNIAALDERRAAYELSRRPGIALLRALVAERGAEAWTPPESELETLLRTAVGQVSDCPPIRWQAPAPWDPSQRVDGMVDAWGLIIEADGRSWHARVAAFEADRWRDNQAAAHGLRVQRFTYTMLRHRPDEVVAIIEQAGRATLAA